MLARLSRLLTVGVLAGVLAVGSSLTAQEPTLSKEQMRQFLLTAEIVDSAPIGTGVTRPWRLTLSDGTITHAAAFQSVDERDMHQRLGRRVELMFVDSYHYNIAAFGLAELLGLDDMMPVTVERRWNGKRGALSWWLGETWDDSRRLKERVFPPDSQAWSEQWHRMAVFAELVYDTDRNQGNILYTEGWKLWMIDFSRAFRIWGELRRPERITRCDRQLLERLRQLTEEDVERQIGQHLTAGEISALMERRDKLVAHVEQLIAQKGEHIVLY